MNNRIAVVMGLLSVLSVAGCATTEKVSTADAPKASAQPKAPEMSLGETQTATFTVQAVDLKNRLVTLKDSKGKSRVIHVGEEARNLPQLKSGDRVMVKYQEAVALAINRDTTGGLTKKTETVSGTRAELGQKPGGSVRNTVEIIANILAIDQKTRNITFQGPERTLVVKAPAEKDLSKIDVGDQVLLTYVEELAISVEPARSAKSPKKK